MLRIGLMTSLVILLAQSRYLSAGEQKPDAFQSNTLWQGVADADPRWADRKEVPARLRVTERDGESFVATIAFHRPHDLHAARLEGKIKNGEFVAHITKILKGTWGEDAVEIVWKGKLDGENLVLERTNKKNMTATCKLKLDKNPHKSDDVN
jgi:hypothetical protein